MWNILRFIDEVVLGDYWDFRIEWTNDAGRVKDPKALGTYLREQHVLLRRVKADVGMEQIGRASCRERVCTYVEISVVAVSFKKKIQQSIEDLAITIIKHCELDIFLINIS